MKKSIIGLLMVCIICLTGCASSVSSNQASIESEIKSLTQNTQEIVKRESLIGLSEDGTQVLSRTSNLSEKELDVIRLTNEYRLANGLNSLEEDATLTKIARIRASEIVSTWSHTRPNGTMCFDWLDANNYKYEIAGENLGRYQKTAEEVIRMWKESPAHNANMLDAYTKIGVGVYEDEYGLLHYVQIFAR